MLSFSKHNKIHNKVFSLRTKAPVSFLPSENQEKQTAMCSLSLFSPHPCVCVLNSRPCVPYNQTLFPVSVR